MTTRYSYTQLSMYLKCGEQFNRRYVQGEKIPPALAMLRGRGQHEAQELDLNTKIETNQLASEEELVDVAADRVKQDADSADDVNLSDEEKAEGFEKARDTTVDQAVRATRLHHQNVAPLIEPAKTELKLEFPIPMPDGSSRDMLGYADVLEKDDVIRDTKTSMKKPGADAATESDQLGLYAYAHRVLTGRESPSQSLDYLVLSKAKAAPASKPARRAAMKDGVKALKAESAKLAKSLTGEAGEALLGVIGKDRAIRYQGDQTPDDQARTVLRMQEAVAGVEAGFFPPAPGGAWWCGPKWCGYYDTCPYVRGGASVLVPGVNE